MINSINNYSSIYGYQSAINQIRGVQAIQNRLYSNQAESVNSSNSYNPYSNITSAVNESISYVNSYSASMSDLMSSANSLRNVNSAGVARQYTAESSDASVATATGTSLLRQSGSYDVTVSQLATEQVNTSTAVKAADKATEDINLEIATNSGSFNVSVSAVNSEGNAKSNKQLLLDTARAINDQDAGIRASVVTKKDGTSSLELSSEKTGRSAAFTVSGDSASKMGLSDAVTEAQNAQYSVTQNGRTTDYSSSSNKVTMDGGKVSMTLKDTGDVTVTAGPDKQKIVSAMEDFVDSYNSAVTLLSKNVDRGGGTERSLSKLLSYVPGSSQGMAVLGLTKNKDGTLALDKSVLETSLKKDQALTMELISGSSGIAQRSFDTARTGMTTSTASLISNDLSEIQYSNRMNPFNFQNSMNRNYNYAAMNYNLVGALMNYYA